MTLIRQISKLLLAALLAAMIPGCGPAEEPFTDNSKDTAAFAQSIKQLVLSSAERIKTSKQPGDDVRVIAQTLAELDIAPTGEHLATYQELHKLASALADASETGKPSNFQSQMNAIVELANKLPGEVKIEQESGED